jgi:phosphoenolpyruvate carboxykinase (GTP)
MTCENPGSCNTANQAVIAWVEEKTKLCQPERVFWCDGSVAEKDQLTAEAVAKGILIQLDQKKLPGCYYHRSNPNDVARVEQCTFICTESQRDAGPSNNWANPREMHAKLTGMCRGAMRGRTMYVVPYLTARCAGAQCTWCRISWGRSVRR